MNFEWTSKQHLAVSGVRAVSVDRVKCVLVYFLRYLQHRSATGSPGGGGGGAYLGHGINTHRITSCSTICLQSLIAECLCMAAMLFAATKSCNWLTELLTWKVVNLAHKLCLLLKTSKPADMQKINQFFNFLHQRLYMKSSTTHNVHVAKNWTADLQVGGRPLYPLSHTCPCMGDSLGQGSLIGRQQSRPRQRPSWTLTNKRKII